MIASANANHSDRYLFDFSIMKSTTIDHHQPPRPQVTEISRGNSLDPGPFLSKPPSIAELKKSRLHSDGCVVQLRSVFVKDLRFGDLLARNVLKLDEQMRQLFFLDFGQLRHEQAVFGHVFRPIG